MTGRHLLPALLITALATPAVAQVRPPVLPRPQIRIGQPFLGLQNRFAVANGRAEGQFFVEVGLRPPEDQFGFTLRLRGASVLGPNPVASTATALAGLEYESAQRSAHIFTGVGTVSGGGMNVFLLDASGRLGEFRLNVRTTQLFNRSPYSDADSIIFPGITVRQFGPYSEAEAQWSHAVSRVEIGAAVGGRIGSSPTNDEAWGHMSLAVPLRVWADRLSLLVAAGRRPAIPELSLRGGQFAGVGVRLNVSNRRSTEADLPSAPTAGALELVRVPGSTTQHRLVLRLPGGTARNVYIRGDFNDWTETTLMRQRDGTWQTTLDLSPGVYRIEMRTDEEDWRVPPGVVSLPDGFGGEVGILEVR